MNDSVFSAATNTFMAKSLLVTFFADTNASGAAVYSAYGDLSSINADV